MDWQSSAGSNISRELLECRYHNKQEPEEIPPFLQWEAMTHEQINCLLKMTLDEVLGELGEVLGFRQRQSCMREVALLDYYVYGFWWAKESGFSPTQMSFCMAVLHMLRTIEVIRDDAIAPLVEGMSADMHHHDVAPPSSQGQEEDAEEVMSEFTQEMLGSLQ
ncbi:hypothetical protein NHX12_024616, partial [Muraenolepis orangiensis]